ncbi:flagellar biosynthesis protein FlhB [Lachnoclostridium pacaense]|uniref:flagellar biosynthesis protein FlhB n=1 Tax=Enterocloster hominis (ex Hitch et al. 2024) TaxID=1917870 RepID=UPI001D110351|nr:flagellar biosynthesis protein FlhB [Lachnoclostridium pacaense]MCC2820569.1 flagellar biosynthesis protein FlhB [Lachnoclostridium pacaense]
MPADEKTEKATPKRRQDERKKGNVFQSNDVAAVCSMLVLFHSLKALAPHMYRNFRDAMYMFMGMAADSDSFHQEAGREMLVKAMLLFLESALPLLFIGVLTAVAVTFFQTRMAFSMDVLKFKMERISPLKGFKRMFSIRSVVELIKALIKITILGWEVYVFLKGRMEELSRLMEGTVEGALIFTGNTVISLVDTVGVAFIFLASMDYLYQWWEYEKNLRMSKQEIKEEYKQTEGDPQIKGKIREKQRQMASMRMMQNVPKADVIVRNPTHYAVALGYDADRNRAPVVLAKGADHLALKIVEVGEANGVYILEDRPLARGLYASVEVDMEIPEEYYQTVAKILAFVYKLNDKKL